MSVIASPDLSICRSYGAWRFIFVSFSINIPSLRDCRISLVLPPHLLTAHCSLFLSVMTHGTIR